MATAQERSQIEALISGERAPEGVSKSLRYYALLESIERNKSDAVERLLESGIIDPDNESDHAMLKTAAGCTQCDIKIFALLLARIRKPSVFLQAEVMCEVAARVRIDAVDLLAANGFNVDAGAGRALADCISDNNLPVVAALLRLGADPTLKGPPLEIWRAGLDAWGVAKRAGNTAALAMLDAQFAQNALMSSSPASQAAPAAVSARNHI